MYINRCCVCFTWADVDWVPCSYWYWLRAEFNLWTDTRKQSYTCCLIIRWHVPHPTGLFMENANHHKRDPTIKPIIKKLPGAERPQPLCFDSSIKLMCICTCVFWAKLVSPFWMCIQMTKTTAILLYCN